MLWSCPAYLSIGGTHAHARRSAIAPNVGHKLAAPCQQAAHYRRPVSIKACRKTRAMSMNMGHGGRLASEDGTDERGASADGTFQACDLPERSTARGPGARPAQAVTVRNHAVMPAITDLLTQARQQGDAQQPLLDFISSIIDGHKAASASPASLKISTGTERIHITKIKLAKIMEFIIVNIDRRIELLDICNVTGLSASYLCRVMKTDTGLTPYNFVLRVRVDFSRQLLTSTKLPLAEVALACGFSSQSHFCSTFKKFTGQTPGQFRCMAAASRLAFGGEVGIDTRRTVFVSKHDCPGDASPIAVGNCQEPSSSHQPDAVADRTRTGCIS